MAVASSGPPLAAPTVVGRERELEQIERFLSPTSDLATLTLRGEPGIGKSTLWRAGVAVAERSGWRVLRARGSELEAEEANAALRDILDAIPAEAWAQLPPVQRSAIEAVLLRGDMAQPVAPRTLGVATLAALIRVAETTPVLVAVDDSQWLDRATVDVLAHVARRLDGGRIRVLTTRRTGTTGFEDSIERDERDQLDVGPLSLAALHHVLHERLGRSFPRRTLVQIDRAAGGNPLFALELGRALLAHPELAPGSPLPIPADVRALVDSRIRDLPVSTRAALLRLALAPTAPVDLDEVATALRADVVVRGRDGSVEFSHPIFAAAVHELATPAERRRAHATAAAAETDPERRARHLALSIDGADPEVAAALDAAATAARIRGSVIAAAELAQLAVDRTAIEDRDARDRRRLALAVLLGQGGDAPASDRIAQDVVATSENRATRARAYYVLAGGAEMVAGIETAMRYTDLAIEAAAGDPHMQAEVHAYAARAFDVDIPRKLAHAHAAVAAAEAGGVRDLVLAEALIGLAEAEVFAGLGFNSRTLERAEAVEEAAGRTIAESREARYIRAWLEVHTEQLDAAERDFQGFADYTEAAGLDFRNARSHIALAVLAIRRGDLDAAEPHVRLVEEIDARTGGGLEWPLIARATIAAHRGALDDARAIASEAVARSAEHQWQLSEASVALGLAELLAGAPGPAVASFDVAAGIADRTGMREPGTGHFEPDRIEALILAGDAARAVEALDVFEAHGRRLDRPWILGTSLRCRALLAAEAGDLDGAAALLGDALEQHRRLPMRIVEARTQLVLGMVERRRRRYQAARAAFLAARALAGEGGAGAWVAKADAELARTHVRETPAGLTPTERQVSELAAAGLTNREIAARLFVSPKTVEANLARAYRKLGIGTRAQLGAALARSTDQT